MATPNVDHLFGIEPWDPRANDATTEAVKTIGDKLHLVADLTGRVAADLGMNGATAEAAAGELDSLTTRVRRSAEGMHSIAQSRTTVTTAGRHAQDTSKQLQKQLKLVESVYQRNVSAAQNVPMGEVSSRRVPRRSWRPWTMSRPPRARACPSSPKSNPSPAGAVKPQRAPLAQVEGVETPVRLKVLLLAELRVSRLRGQVRMWACRGRPPSGGPPALARQSARPDTPTKLSSRNARRVRIQASVCKARITRRSMSTITAGPCTAVRCVRRAWSRLLFIILLLWRRRWPAGPSATRSSKPSARQRLPLPLRFRRERPFSRVPPPAPHPAPVGAGFSAGRPPPPATPSRGQARPRLVAGPQASPVRPQPRPRVVRRTSCAGRPRPLEQLPPRQDRLLHAAGLCVGPLPPPEPGRMILPSHEPTGRAPTTGQVQPSPLPGTPLEARQRAGPQAKPQKEPRALLDPGPAPQAEPQPLGRDRAGSRGARPPGAVSTLGQPARLEERTRRTSARLPVKLFPA